MYNGILNKDAKFTFNMTTIPLCRGCIRPILDNSLLLLLPYWNQNNLNGTDGKLDGKPQKIWSRTENQENRRPLRECQDSLTEARETLRDPSSQELGKIDCYHAECLSCCECGGRLTPSDKRCWKVRDYQVICHPCRTRLTHCGRCHLRVTNDVWVHKVDRLPFHIACLTCSQCGRQLRQGDRCGLIEDRLLCGEHFLTLLHPSTLCERADMTDNVNKNLIGHISDEMKSREGKEIARQKEDDICTEMKVSEKLPVREADLKFIDSSLPGFPATEGDGSLSRSTQSNPTYSSGSSQSQTDQPLSILMTTKSDNSAGLDTPWYNSETLEPAVRESIPVAPQVSTECAPPVTENGHSVDSSTSSGCSAHSKSKRIRTSFTPDQLAILQANFDIEANPDGQELERIANVARLNKRVTQVWFQNARARKKKIECKGIGPSSSMQLNPSVYYLQEASNSEDYFDPNDEQILGLSDPNQSVIGDSSGPILSSYTSMGSFKAPGATQDGGNEVGPIISFAGINFSQPNSTELDLIHRRCLVANGDPIGTVDRVYSILNNVKNIPTQCFPEPMGKETRLMQSKRPDSLHAPPWSNSSDEPNRGLGGCNLTSSLFLNKSPNEGIPFTEFGMHHSFALPPSRCLTDEVLSNETNGHSAVADPMRPLAVFSRV